jgi:hypothetical protein
MLFRHVTLPILVALISPCIIQAGVTINEVRPWSGSTGVGDPVPHVVKLYNAGESAQDLTGWWIGGASALDAIPLPSWTIPQRCYLTVHFESGADDSDFSDSVASYYAGDLDWYLHQEADEVGLYSDLPGPGSVVDFVGWGYR